MSRPRPSRITPEILEKEAEVIRLRRAGMTFDMIAQRVGYADPSGAQKAYVTACKRIVYSEVDAVRREEQDRLDIAQTAIWSGVLRGDIPSINSLLKIMERRAKLLGLDMPVRVQQEVTVWNGDSNLDREIQTLISQLESISGSEGDLADTAGQTGATATGG